MGKVKIYYCAQCGVSNTDGDGTPAVHLNTILDPSGKVYKWKDKFCILCDIHFESLYNIHIRNYSPLTRILD